MSKRKTTLGESLKQLGEIQVTEWDFRTVMPVVRRTANLEVDVVDCFRRAASYKVMEWDFRKSLHLHHEKTGGRDSPAEGPGAAEMQALIDRLKAFLEFVTVRLIDEPGHARIKAQVIAPNVLRMKLVLVNRDVAMLIGTGGHTAAAMRNILKAAGARNGVQVLLQVQSHEEEMATIGNTPDGLSS